MSRSSRTIETKKFQKQRTKSFFRPSHVLTRGLSEFFILVCVFSQICVYLWHFFITISLYLNAHSEARTLTLRSTSSVDSVSLGLPLDFLGCSWWGKFSNSTCNTDIEMPTYSISQLSLATIHNISTYSIIFYCPEKWVFGGSRSIVICI